MSKNNSAAAMAAYQPVLVQLWTNGRPVPTGTLVPVEGATLRMLLLYGGPAGEVVRFRAEVTDVIKGDVTATDPEIIGEETAASAAELLSLTAPLNLEPSHLLWRVEQLGDRPSHWGQNLHGAAARIVPVVLRDTGDGLLAGNLVQAGIVPAFQVFTPEVLDTTGVYVALAPPRLGHSLRAYSGLRFLRSNVGVAYSAEQELIDAAKCASRKEEFGLHQAAAWS